MTLKAAVELLKSVLLAAVCALFLGACALPEQGLNRTAHYQIEPMSVGYARFNSFFSLKNSRAPAVRMELAEMSVLVGNVWLPVTSEPLLIDSEAIADGQIFLGAVFLPQGDYSQLRFVLKGAQIRNVAGEWKDVAGSMTEEVYLSEPLLLDSENSVGVFVSWDVEGSVRTQDFTPVLEAEGATRQLPVDLLYVGCPDIDTIFVVRTDEKRVVDVFGLKGGPSWISAVASGDNDFLYVLAERERLIKVVDLSTFRTLDFFPAPLNDQPSFMVIDPSGGVAFLLDEKSGYVSRMSLTSGHVEARSHIGFQPHFATYLAERNLLAVSLSLSQEVLLLDPYSLDVVGRFSTGGRPQGMLLFDQHLYVAEQGDGTVAVFDLNSGRNLGRVVVGHDPTRIVNTENQIYVSHPLDATLTVLMPGQQAVMREIDSIGTPREMVFDERSRRLFVADEQKGGLGIIDVNTNLLTGRISFGARAVGLTVIQ